MREMKLKDVDKLSWKNLFPVAVGEENWERFKLGFEER